MGAVIPADHGEAAVASHVPGLPTIIQHHSSDGKQNKSSGKLGKLGKNSHRKSNRIQD